VGVNGQPILFEKRRQFHRGGGCSCWCHWLSIKSCSLLPVRTVRPRAFRPPSSEEFPRGLRLLPIASDIRAKVRHPPRKVSLPSRESCGLSSLRTTSSNLASERSKSGL